MHEGEGGDVEVPSFQLSSLGVLAVEKIRNEVLVGRTLRHAELRPAKPFSAAPRLPSSPQFVAMGRKKLADAKSCEHLMGTLKMGQSAVWKLETGERYTLTCIGEGGQHGHSRLACDACLRAGLNGRDLTGFTQYGDLIKHVKKCEHVKAQDGAAASSSANGDAGAGRGAAPVLGAHARADEVALIRRQLEARRPSQTKCKGPIKTSARAVVPQSDDHQTCLFPDLCLPPPTYAGGPGCCWRGCGSASAAAGTISNRQNGRPSPPHPHPLMHGCTWCGGTTTILLFLICGCLPLLHTQEAQSSAGEAADLRQQLQAKPQLSTYGWPPPLPPPSPLAPCTVVPGMTSGTNTNNFLPGCLPLCEQGLQATAGEAAELRRQLQAQSLQSTWMAISPPFSPLSFSSPPSQASGTAIPGMWLPPDCPLFENAGG